MLSGGAAVGQGVHARRRASPGRAGPHGEQAAGGWRSGRLSTSHSGIPAHSAMNGMASSTFIQTMVVMCYSFRVTATLPGPVPGTRQTTSALVMNP